MDWGIVTAVVAALFAAIGLAVGLFMAKLLSSGEDESQKVSAVEEEVKETTGKISQIIEDLRQKLLILREDKLSQIKEELAALEREVKELRKVVATLPLSAGSLEALESAEKLLKEVDFSLPSVDNSLLTQIRDNLIILRNDVQALSLAQKEPPPPPPAPELPNLDDILLSLNTAIKLSKKVNAALVESELLGLASYLKGDIGEEVFKNLDEQAISSKELVLILEQLKKELEGVNK